MLKDKVLIKYLIEDLFFGGHQLSTEQISIQDTQYSLILQAFSCMENYLHLKSISFRYFEPIFGRKFTKVQSWIFVRFLTKFLTILKLKLFKRKMFILEKVTSLSFHVQILHSFYKARKMFLKPLASIKAMINILIQRVSSGLMCSLDGEILIVMILRNTHEQNTQNIQMIPCLFILVNMGL